MRVTETIGWLVMSLLFAVVGGVLWAALVHRSVPAGAEHPRADRE